MVVLLSGGSEFGAAVSVSGGVAWTGCHLIGVLSELGCRVAECHSEAVHIFRQSPPVSRLTDSSARFVLFYTDESQYMFSME